jgi:hypothetical protein
MPADANYDESLVPAYELPDPLIDADGRPVDAGAWPRRQRGHIRRLFEDHVYGRMPTETIPMTADPFDEGTSLGGAARRRQTRLSFGDATGQDVGPWMDLLLYLPADASGPVPVFLGLNFGGNHTVQADSAIRLSPSWMRPKGDGVVDHRATEAARGTAASRWPVDAILARGYGVATIYYGDIDPDYDDGYANGVHPLFYREGQTAPEAHEWGSIGAWAWGLSRALDHLLACDDVDGQRVAVMGHSRLGKTALWAGACDERFALTISNDSGCGGAALARRRFGETVGRINTTFPHWFCDHHRTYDEREDDLPVDQHELIALMAPRPVYVASAIDDQWADPRGEFLGARHAGSVFELLGRTGLNAEDMPDVNQPLLDGAVGYHVRTGGHDVTEWDWQRFMDFADRHVRS